MGHRALVAYEGDNGLYSLHYSHWGAHGLTLKNDITEEAPLGGGNSEPEFVSGFMDALEEGLDGEAEIGGRLADPQEPTDVDAEPLAVGLTLEEIIEEHFDFLHHEAFYVVDSDFQVSAYHPVWFADLSGPSVGEGVLIEVPFEDGEPKYYDHLKGTLSAYQQAAEDMAKTETVDVTPEAAKRWFIDRIRTEVWEKGEYDIPEFSPYGYPAENCRKGGFALSEIPVPNKVGYPEE